MPLEYSLIEKLLMERPDDYSAQTQSSKSYNLERFRKCMLAKGTAMTETDTQAAFTLIESPAKDITLQCGTLTLPLFNTSFFISGIFEGPMDNFDANRYKPNVNITRGTVLCTAEKETTFEKTKAISPQPIIQKVKDTVSGKGNEELTPNGVVELRGYNTKIDTQYSGATLLKTPKVYVYPKVLTVK